MITIQCGKCGQTMGVAPAAAGRQFRCSGCGDRIFVPADGNSTEFQAVAPGPVHPTYSDAHKALESPPGPFRVTTGHVVTGIAGVLALGLGLSGWLYFDGKWERDHRADLEALKSDAEDLAAHGQLKEALHKYDSLFKLLADHQLADAQLLAEVSDAREARKNLTAKVQQVIAAEQAEEERKRRLAGALDLIRQGMAWEAGQGVAQDLQKAADSYREAAQAGLPEAWWNLGRMYDPNENTLWESPQEAAKCYRQAVSAGHAQAMFNLGRLCLQERNVTQDQGEAERLFTKAAGPLRQAAQGGDARAMLSYGIMLAQGWGTPVDTAEGLKWIAKAADSGNSWATVVTAQILLAIPKRDQATVAEAREMLRHAAEEHNVHAMHHLGSLLCDSEDPSERAEGDRWQKKAADQGLPAAMTLVGLYYAQGLQVTENPQEAMRWWQKAADAGNVQAIYFMAFFNDHGFGRTSRDINKQTAAEWYRKSASAGTTNAMVRLGQMYRAGDGVPKDGMQAAQWFQKAIAAGFKPTFSSDDLQFALGEMYFNGEGVPQDYRTAFEWTAKAATNGNTSAMLLLERMYREGLGTAKDEALAAKWSDAYWRKQKTSNPDLLLPQQAVSQADTTPPTEAPRRRAPGDVREVSEMPTALLDPNNKTANLTIWGVGIGDPVQAIRESRALSVSTGKVDMGNLFSNRPTQAQLDTLQDGYVFTTEAVGYRVKGGVIVGITVANGPKILSKLGLSDENRLVQVLGSPDRVERGETTVSQDLVGKAPVNTYVYADRHLTLTYRNGQLIALTLGIVDQQSPVGK